MLFAHLAGTPESIHAFAERFGALTFQVRRLGGAALEGCQQDAFEPLPLWRVRIAWLRHLMRLHLLATEPMAPGPESDPRWVLTWREDGTVSVFGPDEINKDEALPEDSWMLEDLHLPAEPPNSQQVLVRLYVGHQLTEALRRMPPPSLALMPTEPLGMLVYKPTTLWEALVLQFARATIEGKRFQKCAVCDRWFERGTAGNQAHQVACSGPCRVKLNRQRRAQAMKMAANGQAADRISWALGVTEELVKRWLVSKEMGD
jgi:hypothetical protein